MDGIDNMAPAPDLSNLSLEQLEAMDPSKAGSEPEPTEPQPIAAEEQVQEEPQAESPELTEEPQMWEIGGKQYREDQLLELLSKGEDYTRKTQELSEQRKSVSAMETVLNAWENQPETRPLIIQHLLGQLPDDQRAMVGPQGQATPTQSQPNDQVAATALLGGYTPGARDDDGRFMPEWEQRGYASEMELVLHKQVLSLAQPLAKLDQYVQHQSQRELRSAHASQAANAIMQDLGLTGVTPQAVEAAIQATGIQDGYAAWTRQNAKALVQQSAERAVKQVVVNKPNAPGRSSSNVIDIDAKDKDGNYLYSAHEAAKIAMGGKASQF